MHFAPAVVGTSHSGVVLRRLRPGDGEPRDAGKVRRTERADGQPFDWQELLGDLFHVQSAEKAPRDASVSIYYRGHFFFIPDNDLETKSTFVLLTQLMSLHSAPATNGPAMAFSFGK